MVYTDLVWNICINDIEPGTGTQTDSQTDTDLSDLPPAKRLRTDSDNVL
jgi:hypothetical protein